MVYLPLILYGILLTAAIVLPIRWALVAYLMLSTVDFASASADVGVLNATKGLVWPVIMLWRLRAYAGHTRIVVAPIAWLFLMAYASVASMWSLFPLAAAKLVMQMAGSFLICMVFMRATKGGFLKPATAFFAAAGCIAIAAVRMIIIHTQGDIFKAGGDSTDRFTAFTSAQAFAALMAAFYVIALCSRSLLPWVRASLSISIAVVIFFDGSRIWLIAMAVATLIALLISELRASTKILVLASVMLAIVAVFWAAAPIISVLRGMHQYRIAAAIVDAYDGDQKDTGLGTFRFRRALDARAIEMISESSGVEIIFGHGTSNGRMLGASLSRGIGDPNRAVHNEWFRIIYEWGMVGLILWLLFLGSLMMYAYKGMRVDGVGYAKPLLSYVPAFCIGVTGENILAGAGHAENIGILLLIALASIAYRTRFVRPPQDGTGSMPQEYALRDAMATG
jgi:O-antigen ligase